MSVLGQKQTFALHQPMSALPPRADMCGALAHVCFGPKADILFDYVRFVPALRLSEVAEIAVLVRSLSGLFVRMGVGFRLEVTV